MNGHWPRWARVAVRVALALLAAAFVLGSGVAVAALVSGDGPDGWNGLSVAAVLATTAVGAAVWPPARRWAHATASRLTHGAQRTPDEVVRSFGRRAGQEVAVDELLIQLVEALVRVMRGASAEVWRDSDGVMERVVSIPTRASARLALDLGARRVLAGGGVVGRAWLEMWQPDLLEQQPTGEVRVAPATHAGELLGLIVVGRLAGADRFRPDEDASLAELGSRLGVVLHNRELDRTLRDTLDDLRRTNDELRASRVRLVATADAERRRLERDLHDGAQQHLVALAVNLRLAADEIRTDPSRVADVFSALDGDVRDAIDELRSLAHGIYPPVLMDAGLPEALRVAARRAASPATVTIDAVGRYSSETEAAVYFCCVEALQNVGKHAAGAATRVRLTERDAVLELIVEDDGPGIGPDAVQYGHGLGNMADRMIAAGGTLDVGRSTSGGTQIVARVRVDPQGARA